MGPAILLVAVLVLYGVWAVAMKIVGDHVSLAWASLVGLAVWVPADVYFLSQLRWPPPQSRYMLWSVVLTVSSVAATVCYLKAAKYYSGPTLTSVTAIYPLVALPIFMLMGSRPTRTQFLGVALAAVGAWLVMTP